ncbi:MAG: hypothetical protein KDA60_06850 [Planctomycetales bacterium]|nr:hypothetical protein [Planctomycetales bacterium]
MASKATFHHAVWQVELRFKPLRMMEIDVASANGSRQRELVWYLVYQLRNTGSHLKPVPKVNAAGDEVFEVERVDHQVRCFPNFVLASLDHDRLYEPRMLPDAVRAIHAREIRDPRVKLYNTVDVSTLPLDVSTEEDDRGIWCVVTWTGVDPRSDFLSLYVQGLTNAYQWEDPKEPPSENAGPVESAVLTYKTLQLNFWRPGDTIRESEDDIYYGMPDGLEGDELERVLEIYGVEQPVDYRWVYRP